MRHPGTMSVRFGLAAGALAAGMAIAQAAPAQSMSASGPSGPAAEVQKSYEGLKANILKAADRMPADAYAYQPTPEIRTFARVVNHITEAQGHACAAANGTASTSLPKVPAETAEKASIVGALGASFAECDKAYAALTDANMTEIFSVGPNRRSRIGLMWGNVSHDNEQYATLALYLRLKGIVPPSSEK